MSELNDKIHAIICDPKLDYRQKARLLSLTADEQHDYPEISKELRNALDTGLICDMFEGHAPYKPRYVLPDYQKFLQQGSAYLELDPATDFDEALAHLMIIYHHVPSVTGLPVFLGYLDQILLPFVGDLNTEQLTKKMRLFWIQLDRIFPDAFVHANIGPADNILCQVILKVDAELQQAVPNLTYMFDPATSSETMLRQATDNICTSNKPHVANFPVHEAVFPTTGFGIVSCYNALPLAGGANTLVRLNLKTLAESAASFEEFIRIQLPKAAYLMFELIEARTAFLHEKSGFFQSFLVQESLIFEDRFSPMWGVYGMAEASNLLAKKMGLEGVYGSSEPINEMSHTISKTLHDIVKKTPVSYGYQGRALLHSQAGISSDEDASPGTRITYGDEPELLTHIKAVAGHHTYYESGISDILSVDETIKSNPAAMYQLCQGALKAGMREFTANVSGNDLIRITGYMVKLSEVKKLREQGSRNDTTALGAEAIDRTGIKNRNPRIGCIELEGKN